MAKFNLQPKPLTRNAFEPFGDVIETEGAHRFSINNGAIERFHNLAKIDIGSDETAAALFSIAECNIATRLPFRIHLVERHQLASQAFYPLFDEPMIVVVAPQSDQVSPSSLQAFYSNGKQGINFYQGVWHIPLIASRQSQKFIIVDRGGPGNNCEEFYFDSIDEVTVQDFA